jgi:hypothetical protein
MFCEINYGILKQFVISGFIGPQVTKNGEISGQWGKNLKEMLVLGISKHYKAKRIFKKYSSTEFLEFLEICSFSGRSVDLLTYFWVKVGH